ncbi:FHA domain-containing protein [Streptomyces qinzhouensis]|uniref:FHA domain-containing protein n=1 Tax=Streptomyces qinzhouensis TaxID=2599401 RepID=A0A5B8JGM4_9ACTN|nr:FHA domain-containing protein [Streptomyces qinzhouensis]QDY80945.1 FHA domain-containing protein [Streptomyces qinzhouensis]
MQIRLTVLAPRGGQAAAGPAGGPRACDVLVTAPAGTALSAVASGLAAAVAGPEASGPAVLYAGGERLDTQRRTLGEPPLVDGAVLSLQSPGDDGPSDPGAEPQLHVVAGPDAGGVHLLHGGRIGVGRSAEADVPLDDPDVSRLHCAVTVADDGRVTVADLGSTNGTTLDGRTVGERPVPLRPGALLRLGESTLRLTAPGALPEPLPTVPDGEGRLRIPARPPGTYLPEYDAGIHPVHPVHPVHGPDDTPADPPYEEPPADRGPEPADAGARRKGGMGGIGAWARRFKADREPDGERIPAGPGPEFTPPAQPVPETWPDPAAVLLTALGPGPRLWERDPGHPESLVLRLGSVDRDGLPSVPVTVGLREAGSLGLAGPRTRLTGAARWAVAQLAALHSPAELEIVLLAADRSRPTEARRADWAWLGWLPQLRPAHGQDCRLLLAYDRDQAAARTAELTRRLDDGPLGPGWPSADRAALSSAAARYDGPRSVVIVDGDPGSAALRETAARLASAGWSAGIHLIVLAETPAASPSVPVAAVYETACAASLPFRECGAVGLLSGDVATGLRVLRTSGGLPAGQGTPAVVDAVSAAWAERFARALAPLRTEEAADGSGSGGRAVALPRSARLLDELGLARATPASLMARWAAAGELPAPVAVLGAGPRGPLSVDLTAEGPHLLIEGPPGSGRTELLRSVAASLAAAGRPDRLGLLLVDGAGGGERGAGLAACTDLPHVTDYLVASDPVRMRTFAQSLGAELKRRAELLGETDFAAWHTLAHGGAGARRPAGRVVAPRSPSAAEQGSTAGVGGRTAAAHPARPNPHGGRGDLESPPSSTLRLRPGGRTRPAPAPGPLPRLVVLVDDFDALVAPALGSTGRPSAGSVVRALEAVARDGERLGVHLVAASARPDRTADTALARSAGLRAVLGQPPAQAGPDAPLPGRGRLGHPDGRVTDFQGGRVTGRIPRTATLRPTVVPLEWERMGDPPTRRPVRELGNGPTDLALLASALERAAGSVDAAPLPPLAPVTS